MDLTISKKGINAPFHSALTNRTTPRTNMISPLTKQNLQKFDRENPSPNVLIQFNLTWVEPSILRWLGY